MRNSFFILIVFVISGFFHTDAIAQDGKDGKLPER